MSQLFTTTHKGKGPFKLVAEFMNLVGMLFNNFKVFGYGRVTMTPQGMTLYIDGTPLPWSKIHLSTRMTGAAEATIQGGSFWVGTNAAVTLATSTRTILHDLQYLWLEYDFDTNALTLELPGTSLPTPNASSPYFILPLAKFSFDGTTAAITDYLYLGGDYHLPGTWAR